MLIEMYIKTYYGQLMNCNALYIMYIQHYVPANPFVALSCFSICVINFVSIKYLDNINTHVFYNLIDSDHASCISVKSQQLACYK